jgi:FAD:protein FMN transferase
VQVATDGDDEEAIAAQAAETFEAAERRFSRFRADSELSALNRAEGPFVASRELFALLERARAYVELTSGLFDPGVGGALCALGYDRSFTPGGLDRPRARAVPRSGTFLDVLLERATRTVFRPRHVQLDLGGIAKGATVDEASSHLRGAGAIDAGGDAVLRGAPAGQDSWLVDVEDPTDASRTLATLAVSDAAVATSAGNRRRWRVAHTEAHHLIDPRTQTSAASDLTQVTVVAPTAELADVLAKSAFLLGACEGRRFVEAQPRTGAVLVLRSGRTELVGALDVREVAHA